MVPAAWILLGFVSCKAEDLGVVLPRVGLEALSQEDLKRDYYLRSKAKTEQQRNDWISNRLQQMGLEVEVSENRICGKGGTQKEGIVVSNYDDGSFLGMISSVSLISLAKVFNRSEQQRQFCAFWVDDGLFGHRLDALVGDSVKYNEQKSIFYSENNSADPQDLDYRQLEKNLRWVAEELTAE